MSAGEFCHECGDQLDFGECGNLLRCPRAKGTDMSKQYASEMEWLLWFFQNADFGPADGSVRVMLEQEFERETGKKVPKGYGRYEGEE